MAEPITAEEWLAELGRLEANGDGLADAITTEEISERTGRSEPWVRRQLRKAIRAGKVEAVRRPGVDIAGRAYIAVAYRLVRPEKKRGK